MTSCGQTTFTSARPRKQSSAPDKPLRLRALFATPVGRSAIALVASANVKGELRIGLDLGVTADLIMAPLFFRLRIGHASVEPAVADAIVSQALTGISVPVFAEAGFTEVVREGKRRHVMRLTLRASAE